jgi:hypothetical protein
MAPAMQPDSYRIKQLRIGARTALVILNFFLLIQFVEMYRTEYELITPLIPKSIIWEINRQYAFVAFELAAANMIALLFYYWRKYLLVIIFICLALLITRYITI